MHKETESKRERERERERERGRDARSGFRSSFEWSLPLMELSKKIMAKSRFFGDKRRSPSNGMPISLHERVCTLLRFCTNHLWVLESFDVNNLYRGLSRV